MKKATQYLILFLFFFSWTCSLEKIDPSVKYDPCLNKVKAVFTHNKVGISCDSPCVVAFSNSSTGSIKSYFWDFKDGTSSVEKEPTHTFKKSVNVTLTVTADNGCTDSTSVGVTVTSTCVKPTTDFTFVDGQTAPATVRFTNLSLNTNPNNAFEWSVVDGVDTVFKSLDASPQFDFKIATTYQVTLTAKNSCGSKSLTKTLAVKAITFQKILPSNTSDANHDVGNCVKLSLAGDGNYIVFGTYNTINRGVPASFYSLETNSIGDIVREYQWKGVANSFNSESGAAFIEERRRPGGLHTIFFGTSETNGFVKIAASRTNGTSGLAIGNTLPTSGSGRCIEIAGTGGGYIVCGTKTNGQIYLAKLGIEPFFPESAIWSTTVLGTAYCVKNTIDNGFITCGTANNNFYLIKTNANLATSWNNAYPTTTNGIAKSVVQNSKTGEYTACGTINNSADIYILTVNSSGTVVPAKTRQIKASDLRVGVTALNGSVKANCIKETYDGNFIIAGYTSSSTLSGTGQALLIKMNEALDKVLWVKNYGGLYYSEANFVEETPDGGYIFTGQATTNPSVSLQSKVLLVKTDKNGNVQ